MRQLQISVQNEKLEEVLDALFGIGYENVIRLEAEKNSLLILRAKDTSVPKILEELNKIGLGTDYGIIDILAVEATVPQTRGYRKGRKGEGGRTSSPAYRNGGNNRGFRGGFPT